MYFTSPSDVKWKKQHKCGGGGGNAILLRKVRMEVKSCVTERYRGGGRVWKTAKLALRRR